jgi:hypothetical protein
MKAAHGTPFWETLAQFAVCVILADSTNEQGDPRRRIPAGYAWVSKTTIGKRLRCSSRYVVKVINELETLGRLEVRRGEGPRGSNLYRLTTSVVQFTSETPTTSAVQFTHPPDDASPIAPPVNYTTGRGEPYATGGELDDIPPVRCSSPELLSELFIDPLIERTAASPLSVPQTPREDADEEHQTYLRLKAHADAIVHDVGSQNELLEQLQSFDPSASTDASRSAASMGWLGRQTGHRRRATA